MIRPSEISREISGASLRLPAVSPGVVQPISMVRRTGRLPSQAASQGGTIPAKIKPRPVPKTRRHNSLRHPLRMRKTNLLAYQARSCPHPCRHTYPVLSLSHFRLIGISTDDLQQIVEKINKIHTLYPIGQSALRFSRFSPFFLNPGVVWFTPLLGVEYVGSGGGVAILPPLCQTNILADQELDHDPTRLSQTHRGLDSS